MQTRLVSAVAALVVAMVPGAVAASAAPARTIGAGSPDGVRPVPTGEPRSVTLLTGDRVILTGDAVSVQPGPGRDGMIFDQFRLRGHWYVYPADALELVQRGRLDRRLFDVTTLLDLGYGDGRRESIPLIATHQPQAAPMLGAGDATLTRRMPSVGMSSLRAPKDDATAFWHSVVRGGADGDTRLAAGIGTIWLDGRRELSLDQSARQIGAPAAWAAGYTGTGTTAAVLDSGIDADHPDFAGRIVEVRNFTEAPDGNDTVGHGTHVASILAGSGAGSDGRYRGIAPDADLLIGKVCPTNFCSDSAILAGMVWASQAGADVVNLSLGGPDTPQIDPLEQAINDLSGQTGTLFVLAAGNDGPEGRVSSPASADAALAVGSVDRDESLAGSSSRGPRVGDSAIKPDVTAPGVGIVAARASDGFLGEPVDDLYTRISGTSMATPHAAGAAVLLAQQHEEWSPEQLRAALAGSAQPNPALSAFEQGAGRIDLAHAIEQTVVTSPASVSLGLQPYPHEDDAVLTREVTYQNVGDQPVVLALELEATGPDGLPAPDGMFAVQPAALSVPAGGVATATVTVDTRVPSALGLFSGAVTASGAGVSVRTPVGVDKEAERYDLTIRHLDRHGEVPTSYLTNVLGLDRIFGVEAFEPDGSVTMRLPAGRYHLYSTIHTRTDDPVVDVSALAMPLLDLTEDTTITLDARDSRPMRVHVPEPSARSAAAVVMYERHAPDGLGLAGIVAGPDLTHAYSAQVGPTVSNDAVVSAVHSQWGDPGPAGLYVDSPYAYLLVWFKRGGYWTGLDRTVRRRDLAVVDAEYRTHRDGRRGTVLATGTAPEGSSGAGFNFVFDTPFERTEYYLARDSVWRTEYQITDPVSGAVESVAATPLVRLKPGRHSLAQWDRAVHGPAFPEIEPATQWVYRQPGGGGDSIAAAGPQSAVAPEPGSDVIQVSVPVFDEFSTEHHTVFARTDVGRTALYFDDELLGETPFAGSGTFGVPDAAGTYRLEVDGSRPSFADLSTEVRATWRFRSEHDPAAEFSVLPLMAIRFGPTLDENNSAPAGRPFRLPVDVQRQTGATPAELDGLELEVSYDDGAIWRPVKLLGNGTDRHAILHHPARPGYVSLRASATDSAGNSVEQTILRAYSLRA